MAKAKSWEVTNDSWERVEPLVSTMSVHLRKRIESEGNSGSSQSRRQCHAVAPSAIHPGRGAAARVPSKRIAALGRRGHEMPALHTQAVCSERLRPIDLRHAFQLRCARGSIVATHRSSGPRGDS